MSCARENMGTTRTDRQSMHLIIATEIWGRTRHVDTLADELRPLVGSVTVVDPYKGADPEFRSEEQAYAAFQEHCKLKEYGQRVASVLCASCAPTCLLGFSAGGGAVWSVLCAQDEELARLGICFYGSQIRNMIHLTPRAPMELVFPEHEPHFDVQALANMLHAKPYVRCHTPPYGHGFMNPLSRNYNQEGRREWLEWIKKRIGAFRTMTASSS